MKSLKFWHGRRSPSIPDVEGTGRPRTSLVSPHASSLGEESTRSPCRAGFAFGRLERLPSTRFGLLPFLTLNSWAKLSL